MAHERHGRVTSTRPILESCLRLQCGSGVGVARYPKSRSSCCMLLAIKEGKPNSHAGPSILHEFAVSDVLLSKTAGPNALQAGLPLSGSLTERSYFTRCSHSLRLSCASSCLLGLFTMLPPEAMYSKGSFLSSLTQEWISGSAPATCSAAEVACGAHRFTLAVAFLKSSWLTSVAT